MINYKINLLMLTIVTMLTMLHIFIILLKAKNLFKELKN